MIARLPLAARPADESPEDAAPLPPADPAAALTSELLREFRGRGAEPQGAAFAPGPAPALQRAPGLDLLRPIAAPLQAPLAAAAQSAAAPLAAAVQGPAAALGGAVESMVESATAEGAGGGQTPALDIDAIAQKVYEQLRRRLRIDQERLGRY